MLSILLNRFRWQAAVLTLAAMGLLSGCGDKTTVTACPSGCLLAPDPICRDDDQVVFLPGGQCEGVTCVFDEQVVPCEFGCSGGDCRPDPGPCDGVVCAAPPRNSCEDGDTALTWTAVGACNPQSGECEYESTATSCEGDTVCFEGTCVEQDCSVVTCDDPPSATCREEVAVTFAQLGICAPETLDCSYREFEDDCGARGEVCVDGACERDDSCDDVVCRNTALPFCDDAVAVVPDVSGTCSDGTCGYGETRQDCAATGSLCRNGACADPCDAVSCDDPPLARCEGTVALSYPDVGTCGDGTCEYAELSENCAISGEVCSNGTCTGDVLCEGITCNAAPDDVCDGDVAVLYVTIGNCAAGDCTYANSRLDCAVLGQTCENGACIDLCDGVVCTEPPDDFCTENVATFFGLGSCGGGLCDYEEFSQDCSLISRNCIDGACRAECRPEFCNSPPEARCDAGRAIGYAEPGSCEGSLCVYDEVIDNCAARGEACIDGVCVENCFDEGTCDLPPEPVCNGDVLTTYAEFGTCDEATESCVYAEGTVNCADSGLACDAGECVPLCAVTICAPVPPPTCDGEVRVQSVFPAACVDDVCIYDELRFDCTDRGEVCNGGVCVNPCIGVICNDSPEPYCDSTNIAVPRDPGRCVLGECTYEPTLTDCSDFGLDCDDSGAEPVCFDPCESGLVCDQIPDDFCDGTVQVIHTGASGCVFGECLYPAFGDDCGARALDCLDAECVDRCAGVTCATPPAPTCVNDVAVGSGASGFCLTGVCQYPDRSTDCSVSGRWCSAGQCVDACDETTCPTRTDSICEGQTRVQYVATPPLCNDGVCQYDTIRTNCLVTGQQCVAGACVAVANICDVIPCPQRAAFCEGDVRVTDSAPGTCNASIFGCDYSSVETELECEAPLGCINGACARAAQPGELVITEIFYDAADSDVGREWFEIRNVSAAALPLQGIEVRNSRGQSFTINAATTLAAGARLVLKSSSGAAGGAPGYVYSFGAFNLANTADTLILLRNGSVLDQVAYNEATWPVGLGASISLAPGLETAPANDSPSAWCVSQPIYDAGRQERGTPGFARTTCR